MSKASGKKWANKFQKDSKGSSCIWSYGESDLALNRITCSAGGVGHKKIDKKVREYKIPIIQRASQETVEFFSLKFSSRSPEDYKAFLLAGVMISPAMDVAIESSCGATANTLVQFKRRQKWNQARIGKTTKSLVFALGHHLPRPWSLFF
uniref:Uncharacterized protein n=1 Tax=Populus alba TaxID=43335 RepID=A0A4U5Q4R9_POPAL|nr:hypothetical protein D5086_0000137270 [Populus alba]